MAQARVYTAADNPKNKMIRALIDKGYTEIKIVWTPELARHVYGTPGYKLRCHQIDYLHLGHTISQCLKKIKTLESYAG
jgi:hypothetical protein